MVLLKNKNEQYRLDLKNNMNKVKKTLTKERIIITNLEKYLGYYSFSFGLFSHAGWAIWHREYNPAKMETVFTLRTIKERRWRTQAMIQYNIDLNKKKKLFNNKH